MALFIYVYVCVDTYYDLILLSLHCGIVLLASLQPYLLSYSQVTDKIR